MLLGRVAVIPDVPCEAAWLHSKRLANCTGLPLNTMDHFLVLPYLPPLHLHPAAWPPGGGLDVQSGGNGQSPVRLAMSSFMARRCYEGVGWLAMSEAEFHHWLATHPALPRNSKTASSHDFSAATTNASSDGSQRQLQEGDDAPSRHLTRGAWPPQGALNDSTTILVAGEPGRDVRMVRVHGAGGSAVYNGSLADLAVELDPKEVRMEARGLEAPPSLASAHLATHSACRLYPRWCVRHGQAWANHSAKKHRLLNTMSSQSYQPQATTLKHHLIA